ncbi:MAG: hypothetical protein NC924_06295 [Candidatus Omnitrophica bacterium]|nr:hypothetical protein [Candidatus Omnitrophota bacterium]
MVCRLEGVAVKAGGIKRNGNIKKTAVLLMSGGLLFCAAYWIKCQAGIDCISSFHLADHLPVSFLQRQPTPIVQFREGELIIGESFQSRRHRSAWDKLWMREEKAVYESYAAEGADERGSLLITNKKTQDWSLCFDRLIRVNPGEQYEFSGQIRTEGDARGALGVMLFDGEKKIQRWHYGVRAVTDAAQWQHVSHAFVIPDGAFFMQFRLTGAGRGNVWFDQITFKRCARAVGGQGCFGHD